MLVEVQSLDWLAGDLCDQFEVLVEVEDSELGELRCCGDQPVGDRWCPVLALVAIGLGQRPRATFRVPQPV